MTSDLQALVDSLGNRLGRSVAIDDPNIQLLAYNSHASTVDDARIESIMQRHVSRDLVAHIHHSGATQARDLFTIPAHPELGLAVSRVGMPIRHEKELLGFLWLVESDGPVTDEQVDAIRNAGNRAALILHREYLIDELSRGRERELMRDLIDDDTNLRGTAATQLIADELFASGPITVIVLTIAHDENEPLEERDRLALVGGLDHGRRRRPPRLALQLERANHGILLTRCDRESSTEIDELATAVHKRMAEESRRPAQECTVGIGEPRKKLSDALHSYHEARRAADLARITGVLGPIVRHSELGIYGLLAELPPERLRQNLHQGLRTLLDNKNADTLVATLEAFLDNAGNVQQTAAKLCVHRGSLYYRLNRIEEIAGVSFSNGHDRLALHLGLKLAQVLGIR